MTTGFFIPSLVSILAALKAKEIQRTWPKGCWIPSAMRIFREHGCKFYEVHDDYYCRRGDRYVKINVEKVEELMENQNGYIELRRYFENMCNKLNKK